MAKKGGKKGKKGKGKAPKETMSPAQIEAALATLPQPTLRGEASPRIAIRVNELVAVKFTKDPVGLVEHLKALDTGLNSINEAGWTALMRAARDGMKNHVELLLEAVRQAMPNLPRLMSMVASKLLNKASSPVIMCRNTFSLVTYPLTAGGYGGYRVHCGSCRSAGAGWLRLP